MADDTNLESDVPVLSPALEQENNADRPGREACLVDPHNKSVFYEDESGDRDMSLTCCVGTDVVVSQAPAPNLSASVSVGYAPATHRDLKKTQLFGDNDDMEMTQCLPLGVSIADNSDMDITRCLPLDESASVKSTSRWPFSKRQDGRKERTSRLEDTWTSEYAALRDKSYDLDVSEKVDTAALLMELNTTKEPDCTTEVESVRKQIRDTSLASLSTCDLPLAVSISSTAAPVTAASIADWKAADTLPISISEQDSERLLSRIRDPEEIEFRDKCRRLRNSSSNSVAAVEHEPVKSDMTASNMSTDEILTSFIKSDVRQQEPASTDFLMLAAPEADGNRTAASVNSGSLSSSITVASPVPSQVELPSTATSSSISAFQPEKLATQEAEHVSRLADAALKLDDASASLAFVRFGADVVESLFATKESCEVVANNLTVADGAVTDDMRTTEQQKLREIPDTECATVSGVTDLTDLSTLQTSTSYDQKDAIPAETDARKPSKAAVPNMVQSVDDLLTRVKLASTMLYQTASKFPQDYRAHPGFQPGNSAVKQNRASAYGAADKTATSSLHRPLSTASAFKQYESLHRTRELARTPDMVSAKVDASGNNSRMDLSAQRVELTDTLTTTGLASFSLTENLDLTKQEEMHLEPIRSVKSLGCESPPTSSCADLGESSMETSAARNAEFPPAAKVSSQSATSFTLPATVAIARKSSSDSAEEISSLPTTDFSESSVFMADSETGPTGCTHVPPVDVGPTSVSNDKVQAQSDIFRQLL